MVCLKLCKRITGLAVPFFTVIILICGTRILYAQGTSGDLKWLRIGSLQTYFCEEGAEEESGGLNDLDITFCWPAAYGLVQSTMRARCMWLGCKDFYDTKVNTTFGYKVVASGPRDAEDQHNQVITPPEEFKLIGKYKHPTVMVDNQFATVNTLYDVLDEDVDPDLPADRMIIITNHTSLGVTVTKKVYAFSHQDHDNYFIYDYVLTNTGKIDLDTTIQYQQTLEDFIFYLGYRYSFAGESVLGYNIGWGTWNSAWGRNTVNDVVGTDPSDPEFSDPISDFYQMRAHIAWYGPHSQQKVSDDWGCPNYLEDGVMAAAKYGGCITLHADRSPGDQSDDPEQPKTTHYLDTDADVCYGSYSQYDEAYMEKRYTEMEKGHASLTQAEAIEASGQPANEWGPGIGGSQSTQGFGPYTLAPGDSIHIVLAQGIAGLSREKNREVGGNWLQWEKSTGRPTLIMPDGSSTTDFGLYKRSWVWTGKDSLIKTFRNAMAMYDYLYADGTVIPEPPPPPNEFIVQSGGDRISLSWADNASSWPGFDGYVIYRSEGSVLDASTVYQKIFECDAATALHQFNDVTATRGFDYYYYIQTKAQDTAEPGRMLYSSMFWTLTSVPANLLRPAGTSLREVRVVPNPYDIRARMFQFGDKSQYDRLAFYGIPGICKLRIFTERGDLIWEKYHDNGSGDELWDSRTSSGQIVVSGIYILLVEVMENITNEESGELVFRKGETVYRKFVIIR
jgi:hypothetical protein